MRNKIPQHVGLIPDGTRRWAKNNHKPLLFSYFRMVEVISKIIDQLYSNNVDCVSTYLLTYLLSKDNLKRDPSELEFVFKAEHFFLKELVPPISQKHKVDVVLVGNLSLLPIKWEKQFRVFRKPSIQTRKLNLLIAYNPFDELVKNIEGKKFINSEDILSSLSVPQPLDIVIRTGFEYRLSMFLPLQSSYAELFFLSDYINDIDANQISRVLKEYSERQRRFGS